MKTVTADFIGTLDDPNPLWTRAVYYKRRYWVQEDEEYTWEDDWTLLPESEIISVAPISWQLDTDRLNEFKTSSVNIILNNQSKQWKHSNRAGYFGPTEEVPGGFEPFWTKYQVRISLELTDGSTESVTIYTGLAVNYIEDSETGGVDIELHGPEALMRNADAERVSTTVTEEGLGTGDGSTTDFTTDNNAVGVITEVSVNGVAKRAGADYSISNLNLTGSPATITFTAAPTAAAVLRVSYIYWKTSETFEDLIGYLCDEAGITEPNRSIDPVIFPNSVVNSRSFNTNAEWQTGTLSDTDATTLTNAIQFDYAEPQTWNDATTGWSTAVTTIGGSTSSFSSDSTGIYFDSLTSNGQVYAYRSQTNIYGDYIFGFKFNSPSSMVILTAGLVVESVGSPASPTIQLPFRNAMVLKIQKFSGGGNDNITINLTDANGGHVNGYIGAIHLTITSDVNHTVRVRYRPNGTVEIYYDGALLDSGDGQSGFGQDLPTTPGYFGYYTDLRSAGSNKKFWLLNGTLEIASSTTGIGTWVSPVIDLGAAPTSWGPFLVTETVGDGDTTYETRTSTNGVAFDSYVEVSGIIIGSALKRYVQIRLTIDMTDGDPYVNIISLQAFAESTVVALANFTGMTVYDAIAALAQFSDYEFGFKSDETFFFRAKLTSSEPDASFQKNVLISVPSVNPGFDRVYSKVRATYGSYSTDAEDDGHFYLGPRARFSRNRLDVDGGSILISEDADVATGIARSYLARYGKARRRPKVMARFLPHLELSDVVEVSFSDNIPRGWTVGDESQELGDVDLQLYGPDNQILHEFIGKLVGVRFDTDNWNTEIDLEEILNV